MIFYDNIEAVQAAYLAKAKARPSPRQGVKIGGKFVATSNTATDFKYPENCPVEVTAKVLNRDITNGLVRDEAPIEITSETPEGFLGGAKRVYAFTTPGLKDNNLKPKSITSGGLLKSWSTCVFPAGHNFMVKSSPITESLFQSSIDGQFYEEASLPEQDQAKCLEKYSAEVKAERNARIADTDDLAKLEDMTVKVEAETKQRALTSEERTALTDYRQALRDLPEADGFPFVSFPAIPDALSLFLTEKIESRSQMQEIGGF